MRVNQLIKLISLATQALFTGGCLVILFVLVPFWQRSRAEDFLSWFSINASNIATIMLPLEVIPLILSIVVFCLAQKHKDDNRKWWSLNLLCNIIVLLLFVIYFKPVNAKMAAGDIAIQQLANELERWEGIHIARTMLAGICTFFCALGLRFTSVGLKS